MVELLFSGGFEWQTAQPFHDKQEARENAVGQSHSIKISIGVHQPRRNIGCEKIIYKKHQKKGEPRIMSMVRIRFKGVIFYSGLKFEKLQKFNLFIF